MLKKTWRKHHKWLGIVFGFFLLMFCVSGIMLNHRNIFGNINISRNYLPDDYHFHNWNNGLLRGTVRLSEDSVVVFGQGGAFLTTDNAVTFSDFNKGLPESADRMAFRNIVKDTTNNVLYGASQYGFFRFVDGNWTELALPQGADQRFANLAFHNDTIILVGRSHLYVADTKTLDFKEITIQAPDGYKPKTTLFKTIWMFHSGEIFGIVGKFIMDFVALLLIFLIVTGFIIWLKPGKFAFKFHELFGRKTIIITLFITITGWCLRPPMMILGVKASIPPIPFSKLDTPNPFNDKLRAIQFDSKMGDYLLSTSECFYSLKTLNSVPKKIAYQPVVSVMGINVMNQDTVNKVWLIGSFSGMFVWDRKNDTATDYFTSEPAPTKAGIPFGKRAISGYTQDFGRDIIAEYYTGTSEIPQPEEYEGLPMGLWTLALEVHTGRIYTVLGNGTLIWIFFAGLLAFWILWSGWKLRKRA